MTTDSKPKTIVIIHHSADYDGLFCREVALRHFRSHAGPVIPMGWDYGDDVPDVPRECDLYMLDIAVPQLIGHPGLVWIDHHKSAIGQYPSTIKGYRIDGVAACRLAYQYFGDEASGLPGSTQHTKEDFDYRRVSEPLAVTLAGEYDVWNHSPSDHDDIVFQFGLDAQRSLDWEHLLTMQAEHYVTEILAAGRAARECARKRNADIIKARSFVHEFEGLKFLTLNTARCDSSTFEARDVPDTGHDALMGFYWNGKTWTVSLYHAAHRRDLDLSEIAVKYGGGGHRGACGFRAHALSFIHGVPLPAAEEKQKTPSSE
jgi:uncharacterized protein